MKKGKESDERFKEFGHTWTIIICQSASMAVAVTASQCFVLKSVKPPVTGAADFCPACDITAYSASDLQQCTAAAMAAAVAY